jgi:hypothetical protein
MARTWTVRLTAFGVLALALGCRTHPGVPLCTTPLLPDTTIGTPLASVPPASPPKTNVATVIQPPVLATDPAKVAPPKDVANLILPEPAPEVKPLLVDAPRPKPGADGFAPGPRVPAPANAPEVVPVVARRPDPPATPLAPGLRVGHAPDYRWVVGVADRHSRGGYWTVRFADIGDDDRWGGKVRLLDDDRLAGLTNGDLVYVRGEVLAPPSAADSAPAYPPYRVTSVTVVEKAK